MICCSPWFRIWAATWKKCIKCDAVLYWPDLERNFEVCPKCDHHIKGRVVTSHTKHDQDNQSQDRQSLCGLSMRINEKGWDIRPGIKSNPLVKSHIQRQNLGKCITWKAKRQVYNKKQSAIVVEYKTNKVIRRKHTPLEIFTIFAPNVFG